MRLLVLVLACVPYWAAACSVADIKVKWMKADFVNDCEPRECMYMKGVALMTNACPQPVGVEFRATAYGKNGERVASRDLWPARIGNIPPGDYTFSLDNLFDYDPSIVRFSLEPIAVKDWWRR